MKKIFLKKTIKLIKKNYPEYGEEKLEEIAYGLESIYITITKMIIIITLAIILGIFKEVIMLLLFYNIIRTNAFGLHATKSIYCLISSIILFVGGVYFCEYINIPTAIKIFFSIISVIILYKYAPADTEKRPIINRKKRLKHKILSTLSGIIYTILIIIFNNNIISNYLLVGMLYATAMIHPLVYKIFNLPYNNYKSYKLGLSN